MELTAESYKAWRKAYSPNYLPAVEKTVPENRSVIDRAEDILAGKFILYQYHPVECGFPPNWHLDPLRGVELDRNSHWSAITDFAGTDIKNVWELSRFSWVFDLARAYLHTNDSRYAEAFWKLVEDWAEHNPPQCGVNWKCGQEASFRLISLCFGMHAFFHDPATTDERLGLVARMAYVTARRVEANIAYALNQQNNHGTSEAIGLLTAGLLFSELKGSERWERRGRFLLEKQLDQLIDADGCFSQYSFTYQRLLIDTLNWAFTITDHCGKPLSRKSREQFKRAGRFLYALADKQSGRLPIYGAHDSSLLLPLCDSDPLDHRPTLQAAFALSDNRRVYPEGPWDEALLWLLGRGTMESLPFQAPEAKELVAKRAGFFSRHGRNSWIMVRCGPHRFRPHHADQLHVDLWWNGVNIACDCGTYSYHSSAPFEHAFKRTRYHNTVEVDGQDQMIDFQRFIWLRRTSGWAIQPKCAAKGVWHWEGEHDGYHRLADPVRHRRAILALPNDAYLVVDALEAKDEHSYTLYWQLNGELTQAADDRCFTVKAGDNLINLNIQTQATKVEVSLYKGEADGAGWRSERYGHLSAIHALAVKTHEARALYVSAFTPFPSRVTYEEGQIKLLSDQGSLSAQVNSNWAGRSEPLLMDIST